MASTSCVKEVAPVPMSQPYPSPLAKYKDVVANPKLFMSTLEKLHSSMGTKFMVPIIGGKELDLCRLFIEVTCRGGIEKLIKERRWKEVTAVFNFPSTATNASFVLRKYYSSLLYHYEQIYYFKANQWTPTTSDALQNQSTTPVVPAQRAQFSQSSPGIHSAAFQQLRVNAAELPEVSFSGSPVVGVIDGKFESGYLVSVSVGSQMLKGVLYEAPQIPVLPASAPRGQNTIVMNSNANASASMGVPRRRRRKKSEIKRRDPAHPKPNGSGYNFFFAEQHARLKQLHHGKNRDISRMIGELWNELKEPEKSVYQEKAVRDKERYRAEMEDYREKLKMGRVISDAVPLQQRLPEADAGLVDVDVELVSSKESSSVGSEYEDVNMDAETTYAGLNKVKEGGYELFGHCERERDAGVQKMIEDKNMLALL
ncbi:High mobility group B protein 15 [Spatholobus suberectus]|nr:High mobility group B protein 15 [Spatholobus suberectus]